MKASLDNESVGNRAVHALLGVAVTTAASKLINKLRPAKSRQAAETKPRPRPGRRGRKLASQVKGGGRHG